MATYGVQPTPKKRSGEVINTATENKQANVGLFSDIFSSKPSPQNLTIPQKDLLIFFRQLAVILQSGVPLAQGLLLISDNMNNRRFADCIQHIAARLSAGEELSLSLRIYPKIFEPLTIGLIEAGEAGGILEQVLDRVALLLEERDPRANHWSNDLPHDCIAAGHNGEPRPIDFHRAPFQSNV